jgi:hypothetical protein
MLAKKMYALVGVIFALVLFVLIAQRCQHHEQVDLSTVTEVKWDQLNLLDYKTGKAPDDVKKLNGTKVKIAGYIVPLTDEYFVLNEFLLVPNAQACIHVPPPPPNLIVHVKLADPLPIEKVFNPAWIIGTLQIHTTTSIYGSASYDMDDATMEEYKY